MARAGLGLSAADLAKLAGVSYPTLNRFEMGKPEPVSAEAKAKLREALEAGGAQFSAKSHRLGVTVPE